MICRLKAVLCVCPNGIQFMLRFKLQERIADLEFRERRRVSHAEIAEATGVGRTTLSKLVNQFDVNVRSEVIDKLCDYFKCPIEDLVQHIPTQDNDGKLR